MTTSVFVNGVNPFKRAAKMGFKPNIFRPIYKEPAAATSRVKRKQLAAYIAGHPNSTPRMVGDHFNARYVTVRNALADMCEQGIFVRSKIAEGDEMVFAYSTRRLT